LKFNGGFGAMIIVNGTHKRLNFLAIENSTNFKNKLANKTTKRKHAKTNYKLN
jgi:hypothetical protein